MRRGDLSIRPATPADAPRVREITEAAYARYIPRIGRRPAPMDADIAAQIVAGALQVLETGTVLGAVVCYPDGDAMHLETLAVAPEATGQGLGRALIAHVETQAARLGLAKVTLYTNAKMTENLAIYPHLGYSEVGRRTEDGFDRVFYEKTLRAP
ncbi:GNAT family N-acetyltransferase [Sagittula sp. M10.9X]|uniref:GNAT family N-acetyltransferase n=2 Tax=Sagittula salina TaxID=2820268 RepID=A0A940MR15_9RHOB|nr:GNAT family N-acetyltransferase [Sagittula salina]